MIFKKLKDKSAQALPEFALCLPLIVLMCGILITVCQLVFAKQVIQSAAFAGCRAYIAQADKSSASAKQEAFKHIKAIVDNADMKVTISSNRNDAMDVTTKSIREDSWNHSNNSRRPDRYYVAEVTVHGYVNLLFPVRWQNETLMPNITDVSGFCAMVIEDK